MRRIKIAPSILSADFSKMGEEVKDLEANGADVVHCDVMDGVFVNNITFGIKMVEDLRKRTSLPLDCHLMIVHPEKYVERFVKAGADIVTVHAETCRETLKDTLALIRAAGAKCGAVINPDTPLSAVYAVLEEVDMLLVMSVFPGYGGQKFIPHVLEKTREARAIFDRCNPDADVEIDGGVNLQNCGGIVAAGVNILVAGNTVFCSDDMEGTIAALKRGK